MDISLASQPARAVWIEIAQSDCAEPMKKSHSLRGLCGLKSVDTEAVFIILSHSLRGLCGLK